VIKCCLYKINQLNISNGLFDCDCEDIEGPVAAKGLKGDYWFPTGPEAPKLVKGLWGGSEE
jgi:hypothetical protein